jgi:hypothetical protein
MVSKSIWALVHDMTSSKKIPTAKAVASSSRLSVGASKNLEGSTSREWVFRWVKKKLYIAKEKNNTKDSNVVPHRSTNLARSCLTSLSRREAVLS